MLSMKNEIEKIWDDVLVKLEHEHDVSMPGLSHYISKMSSQIRSFCLWMQNTMSGVFSLSRKKCTIFIFPLLFLI